MSTDLVAVHDGASFLASLAEAKRYLAACTSLKGVKAIRDRAEALRVWARAQKDAGELEVQAGELRVRAERKMGQLLPPKPTPRESGSKGGERSGKSRRGESKACQPVTPSPDLSRKDVERARQTAAVPEEHFEGYIAEAKSAGEAPTRAGAREFAAKKEREARAAERRAVVEQPTAPLTTDDLHSLAEAGKKFATIYADPPWSYSNQGTSGTMADHYEGMSLEDICALPVGALAATDAHLHLWATSPLLPEAFAVMKAWGFTYKSSLIWIKTGRIGMGNYWRVCHELLLLGVRGKLSFPDDCHDIRSHVAHDTGEHSAKPDVFRGLVERVSPGPRLELFGRESGALAPGWVVWGNQIPRTLFAKAVGEVTA